MSLDCDGVQVGDWRGSGAGFGRRDWPFFAPDTHVTTMGIRTLVLIPYDTF